MWPHSFLLEIEEASREFHALKHETKHFSLHETATLEIRVNLRFGTCWVATENHLCTFHDKIDELEKCEEFPSFSTDVIKLSGGCSSLMIDLLFVCQDCKDIETSWLVNCFCTVFGMLKDLKRRTFTQKTRTHIIILKKLKNLFLIHLPHQVWEHSSLLSLNFVLKVDFVNF